MQYIYPFIISFIFIFLSELGDKTQILVLSFSAKNKATNILFTSHDHQLTQTVANRIIDIKSDKVIDREVTYNEYLGIE